MDTDFKLFPSQIPSIRNVYLVSDAADQAAMGGTAKNVYVTAQAAWDAAVTIVNANATYQVVINVGSITAAIAGTLTATITANTSRISWVGLGRANSIIGNVAFTYTAASITRMSNMTCGTVSYTGTSNSSMTISCENTTWGNLTGTYTGTALATNPNYILQNCNNFTTGTINLSSTNVPTNAGGLNFIFCTGCIIGVVTLVSYSITVGNGTSANSFNSISGIITSGNTINFSININNCVMGAVGNFYNTSNAITRTISFTNCTFTTHSTTGSGTQAGTNTTTFVNCMFVSAATFTIIDGVNFRLRNCSFLAGINNLVSNMIFQNCSIFSTSSPINVPNGAALTGIEMWLCSIILSSGTNWITATGTGTAAIKFTSSGSFSNLTAGAGITLS